MKTAEYQVNGLLRYGNYPVQYFYDTLMRTTTDNYSTLFSLYNQAMFTDP